MRPNSRDAGPGAQDVVADHERRIVGMRVAHLDRHAGQEERVLFVRRVEDFVRRVLGEVRVAVQDVAERLRAAPIAETFREQLADRVGIEVADDDDLGVRRAEESRVQLAQIGDRHAVMNAMSSSTVLT